MVNQLDRGINVNHMSRGIDVYSGDGHVDFQQVKQSGHDFVYLKATEGFTINDSAFDSHWFNSKKVGLIRGAYHFLHTGTSAPILQAQKFYSYVSKLEPGDLPPTCDIELKDGRDSKMVLDSCVAWLKTVENLIFNQTGKRIKPIIYTYPDFWINQLGDPTSHGGVSFGDYPLWIAHYKTAEPKIPKAWKQCLIHQFEGDVAVSGVEKQADLNRFVGLSLGDNGGIVLDIQKKLADLGYSSSDANSVFGPATEANIKAFQSKNNLAVDGIVGLFTYTKLIWS
ncbi:MAG: GH25 family lysozyme [Rhizonema sp. PD38]|nr:GH25 family lysozyme [Rhizonema sp. PD38]